jgi:hypothetical protein
MRPLLGDFLTAAGEHIDAAISEDPQLPAETVGAVVGELGRLTGVMARCVDAFVLDDQTGAAGLVDVRALAVLDARSALRRAAARMRGAVDALGDDGDDARHLAAARLSAATGCLAAGHDLLQAHFAPGPAGSRYGNSPWAPAIVSAPVNAALVTEMGRYAGRLAPWMLAVAATPSEETLPAPARVAISAACRWLRVAEAATWAASHAPGAVTEHALLRAIPANVCPPRCPPGGGETMPDLCAGAIATAERLCHLAHATANRASDPQIRLAVSWQRTAQGASITGHCSELILRQLAESAAHIPLPSAGATALQQAAHATSNAWAAWRAVAHDWDTYTTGPGTLLTPVAAEIGDLVLWVGRLAHTDPAWTPARNRTSPVRTATALADGRHTSTDVVTALHHVSDALAHIAANDRESVRRAAADRDLYILRRLLPEEYDLPYRYVPAPATMTDALLAAYDVTIQAATPAAKALDNLALPLNPQPSVLTALRAVAPLDIVNLPYTPVLPACQPIARPRPGQVEQELRSHGTSEPATLAGAAHIDDAAQDLISNAGTPSQRRDTANRAALRAPGAPSLRRLHPARLATQDSPPHTTSNTPLPRLVPIGHQIRHVPSPRRRPTP